MSLNLAAKRIVEHKNELSNWFDLADWIMAQKDSPAVSGEKASETSKDNANWDSARKKVVDLLEICVDKDKGIGGEWRARIIALLKAACVAEDFFLDKDRAVVTPRDYLTDAINTTRGRALEALLDYGYWVRRNEGEKAEVSEVFEILEQRFSGSPPLAYRRTSFVRRLTLTASTGLVHLGPKRMSPISFSKLILKHGRLHLALI